MKLCQCPYVVCVCHHADSPYASAAIRSIMPNVIMLNVIMPNVIMLAVIMVNAFMLGVIMPIAIKLSVIIVNEIMSVSLWCVLQ
jgi:hypothetical protein